MMLLHFRRCARKGEETTRSTVSRLHQEALVVSRNWRHKQYSTCLTSSKRGLRMYVSLVRDVIHMAQMPCTKMRTLFRSSWRIFLKRYLQKRRRTVALQFVLSGTLKTVLRVRYPILHRRILRRQSSTWQTATSHS